MKQYLENLKAWSQENPGLALAGAATALIAVAKLIQVNTEYQNSKTWKKEVERRQMMAALK